MLKTCTCAQTQTAFLYSHRHISSWAGVLGCLALRQKQLLWEASMIIKLFLSFCDSRQAPARCYDSAAVVQLFLLASCQPGFQCSQREVSGEDYRHFLGIAQNPDACVSKSSVVSVASWILLWWLSCCQCWLAGHLKAKLYPWGKVLDELERSLVFHFLPPSITHGQAHPSSLFSYLLWVNISHFPLSALSSCTEKECVMSWIEVQSTHYSFDIKFHPRAPMSKAWVSCLAPFGGDRNFRGGS